MSKQMKVMALNRAFSRRSSLQALLLRSFRIAVLHSSCCSRHRLALLSFHTAINQPASSKPVRCLTPMVLMHGSQQAHVHELQGKHCCACIVRHHTERRALAGFLQAGAIMHHISP